MSEPDGRVLVLDRDPEAVARIRERLAGAGRRCVVCHENFAEIERCAREEGFRPADGILMDLGMSSFQLDEGRRGFSFAQPGPLDMRMDTTRGPTAAELLETLEEAELADVLWKYGEERHARRIAREIVRTRGERPIRTTGQLADLVSRVSGGRRSRIHPATRTFQGLRIAVNRELACLDEGLTGALDTLRPGGRLAVISFHSLEDRMVKTMFRRHVGRWTSLEAGGEAWEGAHPSAEWVGGKSVTPGEEEIAANPRARSARLRVMERKE
jgi:16S rRNA (cytosine1402-N4)-methyltransferase